MEKVRKFAITYFMLQGVGVLAWWVLLFARPESRSIFQLDVSQTSLIAFWLADISFIAAGSLATAALIFWQSRFELASMWFVTGAVSYASIYSFAYSMISDRGWIGILFMFPAMVLSGVFAIGITVGQQMFRPAKETSTPHIIVKTYAQIIVVWSLILIVFPFLLTVLEDKLGLERLEFLFQRPIAVLIFLCVSTLGIWAAHTMSRIGKGTPLPLDHARELVVLGPYAYVRNPMAVSGVFQGLAVALFLGSPLTVIYALLGSAIWQLVFRPLEEDELEARFGNSFTRYRDNVRCWIPRLSPYQSDATADSSNSVDSPLGRI